jgi:hypothetical protein
MKCVKVYFEKVNWQQEGVCESEEQRFERVAKEERGKAEKPYRRLSSEKERRE